MNFPEGFERDLSFMNEALEPLLHASHSQDVAVASCALHALTVLVEGLSHLDPTNFALYEQLIIRS